MQTLPRDVTSSLRARVLFSPCWVDLSRKQLRMPRISSLQRRRDGGQDAASACPSSSSCGNLICCRSASPWPSSAMTAQSHPHDSEHRHPPLSPEPSFLNPDSHANLPSTHHNPQDQKPLAKQLQYSTQHSASPIPCDNSHTHSHHHHHHHDHQDHDHNGAPCSGNHPPSPSHSHSHSHTHSHDSHSHSHSHGHSNSHCHSHCHSHYPPTPLSSALTSLGLLRLCSTLSHSSTFTLLSIACFTLASLLCIPALATFLPAAWTSAVQTMLLTSVYVISGVPQAVESLCIAAGGTVDTHVLMALAAFGTLYLGLPYEGALLLLLFQVSHFLEERFTAKAQGSMERLFASLPQKATVVQVQEDGAPILSSAAELSASKVKVGDHVMVRPGENVPLDGLLVWGTANISLQHISGESAPVRVVVKGEVPAGSVDLDGLLVLRVTAGAEDSTPARIARMAAEAQANKPQLSRLLERVGSIWSKAVIAVTLVSLVGLLLAGVPLLEPGGALYRAMGVLTAGSPCAVVLVPLAYVCAIATITRRGVLVRSASALDNLATCSTVALDKTGTITSGTLTLTEACVITLQCPPSMASHLKTNSNSSIKEETLRDDGNSSSSGNSGSSGKSKSRSEESSGRRSSSSSSSNSRSSGDLEGGTVEGNTREYTDEVHLMSGTHVPASSIEDEGRDFSSVLPLSLEGSHGWLSLSRQPPSSSSTSHQIKASMSHTLRSSHAQDSKEDQLEQVVGQQQQQQQQQEGGQREQLAFGSVAMRYAVALSTASNHPVSRAMVSFGSVLGKGSKEGDSGEAIRRRAEKINQTGRGQEMGEGGGGAGGGVRVDYVHQVPGMGVEGVCQEEGSTTKERVHFGSVDYILSLLSPTSHFAQQLKEAVHIQGKGASARAQSALLISPYTPLPPSPAPSLSPSPSAYSSSSYASSSSTSLTAFLSSSSSLENTPPANAVPSSPAFQPLLTESTGPHPTQFSSYTSHCHTQTVSASQDGKEDRKEQSLEGQPLHGERQYMESLSSHVRSQVGAVQIRRRAIHRRQDMESGQGSGLKQGSINSSTGFASTGKGGEQYRDGGSSTKMGAVPSRSEGEVEEGPEEVWFSFARGGVALNIPSWLSKYSATGTSLNDKTGEAAVEKGGRGATRKEEGGIGREGTSGEGAGGKGSFDVRSGNDSGGMIASSEVTPSSSLMHEHNKLLSSLPLHLPPPTTPLYVALFGFDDAVLPGTQAAVHALQQGAWVRLSGTAAVQHRKEVVMLTGDNSQVAKRVSHTVGITSFRAGMRPEDKLGYVQAFRKASDEKAGNHGLLMMGDGINDAPALAAARVGVAVASTPSDLVSSAADIIILNGKGVSNLPWLLAVAHKTQMVVKQNLILALVAVACATLPTIAGFFPLWLAVLLHEGSTLLVALNSLRLLLDPETRTLQAAVSGASSTVRELLSSRK